MNLCLESSDGKISIFLKYKNKIVPYLNINKTMYRIWILMVVPFVLLYLITIEFIFYMKWLRNVLCIAELDVQYVPASKTSLCI